MSKFFSKVKNWFVAHKPSKRRLIQVYAALLYNANIKGFVTGKIYTGDTKKLCVPGLNCYSCPGAVGACPLGALQDSLSASGTRAPAYIFGILVLFGLFLGRVICGFLCPFGLMQELLYKIRSPKLRKSRFTRILSYFKYVLLAAVIAIPFILVGVPAFCKYICPAGTLEGAVSLLANGNNSGFYGMLNYLFSWKFCLLVVIVVASVFIYRMLCRFICPLGAIYSFFCRVSLLGVKLDREKCIDCGLCVQGCKMDIKHVGDHECIQCGECISVCPVNAISWKGSQIFVRNTTPDAQPAAPEGEKVDLLSLARSNAEAVQGRENAAVAACSAENEQTVAAQTEELTDEIKGNKGGRGAAVKAAFKKPRFVAEFVAWVVATAVLIAALLGYALADSGRINVSAVGDKCPTFVLETYKTQGTMTEFATVNCRGRVTVINYWYTDCLPCKEELPEFERVYEEMQDEIYMVAVHSWSAVPVGGVQAWLDSNVDKNGKPWNSYLINFAQDTEALDTYQTLGGRQAFPMTVILDADGRIDDVISGSCSESKLRAAIAKAQN